MQIFRILLLAGAFMAAAAPASADRIRAGHPFSSLYGPYWSGSTGWLYSEFAKGTLTSYNYDGTASERKTSAALLQAAIWWLEGEQSFSSRNFYMSLVKSQFGSKAAAKADGGADYGVYALNLWFGDNPLKHRGQDQLYYQPLEITVSQISAVPDGGQAAVLFGLALAGLVALRR